MFDGGGRVAPSEAKCQYVGGSVKAACTGGYGLI